MRKVATPFLLDNQLPFFTLDEKGALATYVSSEEMLQLPLGTIVLIKNQIKEEKLWYSGKIIGLESWKFPTSHQRGFLIRICLLQEWMLNENHTYIASTIQGAPSRHSFLFFPNLSVEDKEHSSPSLQELLNLSKNGCLLGMIGFGNKPYGWETDELIPFKWDTDHLDNKHLLIAGVRGAGKTVFFKNLVYEIKKQNTNNKIILTDSKGDLSQLFFFDIIESVHSNNWENQNDSLRKKELQQAKEIVGHIRLIIPRTNNNPQLEEDILSLLSFPHEKDNLDIKRISLRFQDIDSPRDIEHLFQTNSTQVAILLEDLVDGIKANEEIVSLSRLQSAIARLLARNTSREITLPTNGITYNRSVLELSRRVLGSLEQYFDIDEDVLEYKHPMDYFNFSGTVILYLNHLNREERFMWKMQLLKWFSDKKNNSNTYLFFDEADKMLAKERSSHTDMERRILSNTRAKFEKLVREEKRFGASVILSTRNPQDLHPIVQEYCATKVVMKTGIKNARHLGLPKHLVHITNNFNHGQFWIHNEAIKTADWVRIHGISPPMPHEPIDDNGGFWSKNISRIL